MDARWFQASHSRVLEVEPWLTRSQRKPHGGKETVVPRVGQVGDLPGGQGMVAVGGAATE